MHTWQRIPTCPLPRSAWHHHGIRSGCSTSPRVDAAIAASTDGTLICWLLLWLWLLQAHTNGKATLTKDQIIRWAGSHLHIAMEDGAAGFNKWSNAKRMETKCWVHRTAFSKCVIKVLHPTFTSACLTRLKISVNSQLRLHVYASLAVPHWSEGDAESAVPASLNKSVRCCRAAGSLAEVARVALGAERMR